MALREPVNLFFMVPGRQLGGCTSFTVHLWRCLRAQGYDATIYRVGARTDLNRPTSIGYGSKVFRVSVADAVQLARSAPSLITYCFWRKMGEQARALMLGAGVPLVVHDPAEFVDDSLAFMRTTGARALVIRRSNAVSLASKGVNVSFAPHPYLAETAPERSTEPLGAVCAARVDSRKRTHWLIESNKRSDAAHHVQLWGEIGRVYEFRQLRQRHPDWRRWYNGEFPADEGAAVRLYARGRYAVDLTVIKGDGGGTQYAFFEAWNAGVPLVLNKAWQHEAETDEVRNGDSCLMVGDSYELSRLLKTDPTSHVDVVSGGHRVMANHGPAVVVPQYMEAMRA